MRHILAVLSFILPMLVIGSGYKYGVFKHEYEALGIYRAGISMPLAFGSLIIQSVFWAYLYTKLMSGERWISGAWTLFLLALPLGWSFNDFVIGAKHVMTSVSQFALLETGFTLVVYVLICPLIALSYKQHGLR